jgi:ectoine hydroxylase-related dioxygenase (phytanoyl-CoA dioxygenase family)
VLGDEAVEELRAELADVIEHHEARERKPVLCHNMSANEAPVWQIVNIWEASDSFRALLHHPTIVEEMVQLTRTSELRIWHDQILYKPAETGGVNMWHQDAPLWPVLRPMTEVSAWVALDDVDESNGCMSMVPGSHRWGNNIDLLRTLPDFGAMPAQFAGHDIEVVTCPVRKGEVHYHHALTWHGSHANTGGRPRRAIALHYMTGETRFEAAGQHVMKQFINVGDGEFLKGEHFPLVYPVAAG